MFLNFFSPIFKLLAFCHKQSFQNESNHFWFSHLKLHIKLGPYQSPSMVGKGNFLGFNLFHTASVIALSRSFRKLDSLLRPFAVLLQSSAEFAPCHVCTTSTHLRTSFSLRDMISTRRATLHLEPIETWHKSSWITDNCEQRSPKRKLKMAAFGWSFTRHVFSSEKLPFPGFLIYLLYLDNFRDEGRNCKMW